ncbi:hypothetical protein ACMD2_09856 [Ananas comosus]|uniref:F-box domain-containing protein n=1 Tax=Ananas comosus TaxID=4615 RepID=A0A199UMF2_ANACO|nr:hypothetical protein ACMD2_09856 [Ananas comosus]
MDSKRSTTGKKRKSPLSSSTSSFAMDELGDDVLELVLARLPLPSLLRLRRVSKRWRSASSAASPSFLSACSRVPLRPPSSSSPNPSPTAPPPSSTPPPGNGASLLLLPAPPPPHAP